MFYERGGDLPNRSIIRRSHIICERNENMVYSMNYAVRKKSHTVGMWRKASIKRDETRIYCNEERSIALPIFLLPPPQFSQPFFHQSL